MGHVKQLEDERLKKPSLGVNVVPVSTEGS